MTARALTGAGAPNVIRARAFAAVRHGAQTYNDEVPYTDHLEAVFDVLRRYGYASEPEFACAAYLHDVLEDTNTSYNEVRDRFGVAVAELVYAVTSELGRNRAERNAKTYPKIRGNPSATVLKLADRIANVEYGLANGGKMAAKYPNFRAALCVPFPDDAWPEQGVGRMWTHLDRLLGGGV